MTPILTLPGLVGLSGLALASGAAIARASGPLACTWPAKGQAMLRRLNAVKFYRPVGAARAAAGAVLICALLGAGALAAYAAEPSAPQQLARAAVEVVGSGQGASLTIREAGAATRTLKIGEEYKDGWRLQAVTAGSATLARDGAVVQVGLNSAGAPAPAVVAVAPAGSEGASALAALQQLPRSVVGVVPGLPMGLSLQEDGAAPRVLKVGQEYKDGWKLAGVLSTGAIFAKGEDKAELSVNPAGEGSGPFGAVRSLPMSQTQLDKIANDERNARIAALRAAQGNPAPSPSALAQIERNNAAVALVTAQNQYIRASTLVSMANALMRQANTDDFKTAMQGPAAQQWADALWNIGGCGGSEDECSYEKLKAIVDQGPPKPSAALNPGAGGPL